MEAAAHSRHAAGEETTDAEWEEGGKGLLRLVREGDSLACCTCSDGFDLHLEPSFHATS